jgi:hypothetical protein
MVEALNITTGTLLCIAAALAARGILWNHTKNTILYAIVIHGLYCGVPILLDSAGLTPDYSQYPGIRAATADDTTAVIYCCYVLLCPLLWWRFGRYKRPSRPQLVHQTLNEWPRPIALTFELLLISPAVIAAFAPDKSLYLTYGAILTPGLNANELVQWHSAVNVSSIAAICAGSLLLATPHRKYWNNARILFELALAAWLNGKRFIVALAILLLFAASRYRSTRRQRSSKSVVLWILVIVLVAKFNVDYQSHLRPLSMVDSTAIYNNLRTDFGRDRSLKVVIYRQLYPAAGSILEHPFQSVIFTTTFYIPRAMWPTKPWPYYMYFTAATYDVRPEAVKSGQTASWLDESIANMGWIGLLSGPLLIAWVCRQSDRWGFLPFQILSAALSAFMLSLSSDGWIVVAPIWLGLLVFSRLRTFRSAAWGTRDRQPRRLVGRTFAYRPNSGSGPDYA